MGPQGSKRRIRYDVSIVRMSREEDSGSGNHCFAARYHPAHFRFPPQESFVLMRPTFVASRVHEECWKSMSRLSPHLASIMALALIAASGQCAVACSTEACEKPGSAQDDNLPPCHRHSNAPEKQQAPPVCAPQIAVTNDASSSISPNPTDSTAFSVALASLPMTLVGSDFTNLRSPDVVRPPHPTLGSSTVLRI